MRILNVLMVLMMAGLMISGCQTAVSTNSANAGNSAAKSTENTGNPTAKNPAAPAPAKATGFPPSTLRPEDVSPNKPVLAEELRNAVLAWEGREVAVTGYPSFPRIMSSSITLKGSPDADRSDKKSLLVSCRSRTPFENQEVDEKLPIVVKGTIKGYPTPGQNLQIDLQDCQLVSTGEFSGEKGVADPGKIDVNRPIPAADLHKDFFKWQDKEVAVQGNYNGKTKSSSSSGDVLDIRIDVQNEKHEKVVGCHVSSDPGADDFKERNNRVFKGTIAGASFGKQITLEPCQYVK